MARQLTSVYDSTLNVQGFPYKASGTYTYDPNGNLLIDPYQGITMTYDVLNRTDSTKINGTTYITYTYDVSGSLIRKKAYNSGTLTQTDYIDGFVYTGNGTSQTLAYAPMPEGRLLGTSLTQEYVITDPQGNARVAFQNNGGMAKVTQENSYYGYGLMMPGSLVGFSSPPNKNLYNGGSEWQNDTKAVNAGVPDYYQTFYRNYDPALARFVAVGPQAESTEDVSIYQYSGGNPIMNNDPAGNKACYGCNLGGGGGESEFEQEMDQEAAQAVLASAAGDFAQCGCGVLSGTPGYFSWTSPTANGTAINNASNTQMATVNQPGAAPGTGTTGNSPSDTNAGNGSDPNASIAPVGTMLPEVTVTSTPLVPLGIMLQPVTIRGIGTGVDLINALNSWQDYENIYHLVPNSIQWQPLGPGTAVGLYHYANVKAHYVKFKVNGKTEFEMQTPMMSFGIPNSDFVNDIDLEIKFSDAWDAAMSTIDDYYQLGDVRLQNPVYFKQEFESLLIGELLGYFNDTENLEIWIEAAQNVPMSTPIYTESPNHH